MNNYIVVTGQCNQCDYKQCDKCHLKNTPYFFKSTDKFNMEISENLKFKMFMKAQTEYLERLHKRTGISFLNLITLRSKKFRERYELKHGVAS